MLVNPCVPTTLDKEATRSGSAITTTVKRQINKYRGTFPAIYTLLLLTVSMCGALGSDTRAPIEATAVKHVDFQDRVPTARAHVAAEDREMEPLRRHSFLVLQHAFSQRTRHYVCQQKVVCMEVARLNTNPRRQKSNQDRRLSNELRALTGAGRQGRPNVSSGG